MHDLYAHICHQCPPTDCEKLANLCLGLDPLGGRGVVVVVLLVMDEMEHTALQTTTGIWVV